MRASAAAPRAESKPKPGKLPVPGRELCFTRHRRAQMVTYEQLSALGTMLSQTQTRDLLQWDANTYKRAIGWGQYFEKACATVKEDQPISTLFVKCLDKHETKESELIHQVLSQVMVSELNDIVDRSILHSPFIDLNQSLLQCVLQRTPSKAAEYLKERYLVDTTLQVAHKIHALLERTVNNI